MAPMNPPLTAETLLAQGEWLRRLAAHLLHDGRDAEDLVQDSWEAALRSPPNSARPIRPWLAQVLRNAVHSRRRLATRRAAREQASLVESEAPSPEELLERARLHERLARLMTSLEEPYRGTLLLRFYDGRSAADIARAMNVPPGTVRWRISEGVRRLRERLDEQPGEGRPWRVILVPLAADRPSPSPRRWAAPAGVVTLAGASVFVAFLGAPPPDRGGTQPLSKTSARVSEDQHRAEGAVMNKGSKVGAFVSLALPALLVAATSPASAGKAVDLDFKNADIKNVLRLLSDVEGVNIWTSDDVTGPVTVKVKGMPAMDVVAKLCADRGLRWQRNDNVILISRDALPPPRPYYGARLDPDFTGDGKGVDVRVAMAQLAKAGGIRIEVADGVKATIRWKGQNMPWDQVLDAILWSRGLRAERHGDVVRILPAR
jgi:RNA polymerase sigma factor (sigma-70 family)